MGLDLRLNLRILMWHLQISPTWKMTLTYNDYHKRLEHGLFKCYDYNLFKPLKYFNRDVATYGG